MTCPNCNSTQIIKNGHRRGKQCYQCRNCSRQFVDSPFDRSDAKEVKQLCLKMYLNGMGLRGIERVTDIHHTTIMNWIREAGIGLADAPEQDEIPEINELQTFGSKKRNKV